MLRNDGGDELAIDSLEAGVPSVNSGVAAPSAVAPKTVLSILIPSFQEERTLGTLLARVLEVDTETLGFAKEVIVCDDGSTDGSVAVAEAAARDDARVVLVRHDRNLGKGSAIRKALERATGEFSIVQDADLEYDVGNYGEILRAVRAGAEAVYGSRFLTCRWPQGMQLANFFGNRLLTWTANLRYGLELTDEATGPKLVRTDLLRSLGLRSTGFEFCSEVTAKLARRGVRIVEVPVRYSGRRRAQGKKLRWRDGVGALWTLLRPGA
jgi:dolichol-phosphate mannosyltransferase